jgi:hypothetical protein
MNKVQHYNANNIEEGYKNDNNEIIVYPTGDLYQVGCFYLIILK